MFGSKGLRYIILLLALVTFSGVSYSADFDYAQMQRKISVQEEFGDYMNMVRDKISNTWTPPDVLENGHATVIFKLDKSGNLISFYLKEGSGNSLYDESALQSIQKAAPYAEFPANASRENITVMYSFDSSVVNANDVKALVEQSERYINRGKGDYSKMVFDGSEFKDNSHPFASDLDVFGPHSLFELYNISHSVFGRNAFADKLKLSARAMNCLQNENS